MDNIISKTYSMSNTTITDILSQSIPHTEYRETKLRKEKVNSEARAKQKQVVIERLKAIGEEILCWLFIASTITGLILFFSNLE